MASQQPSPLTGSGRSSPASLLLPAAHWPTAGRAFPFRIFATSPSFFVVRGAPWPRGPSPLRHRPPASPVQLVSGHRSPPRSSPSVQNPPPLPALRGASLAPFSQRGNPGRVRKPNPRIVTFWGSWGPPVRRWGGGGSQPASSLTPVPKKSQSPWDVLGLIPKSHAKSEKAPDPRMLKESVSCKIAPGDAS